MRRYIFFWLILFHINVLAQHNSSQDSTSLSPQVNIEAIELVHHPIQKHFLQSQNKLEIRQGSRELAGTFDDPARVLYRHVGISTANDQTNTIVYRGLPSEFTRWSINGAEIVNPNHLSNAGRLSDQSSPSAGGVLAIPFEVVNKFSFYGNPYEPIQNNALSGVGDFNFDRLGENFFKVGLLGMEAGFQTKGKSKLKGDFRYSTVGLLSDFGVNFDGESIKFYDGFLKYDINDKLSIIAIAGNSTNYHTPIDSIESASVLKDLQDISFESKFLITGISYKGKKFEHNLFYSQRNNERTSLLDTTVFYSPDLNHLDLYIRKSQKLSYNGKGNFINDNLVLGVQALIGYDELLKDLTTLKGETFTLRPYAQWQYLKQIGQGQFKLQPGLALNYIRYEKLKIEPSLFSQYGIGNFLFDFNYAIKNKDQELNNSERNRLNSERMESLSFAVKYNLPKESISFMSRFFYLNANTKSYRLYSYINSLNNFNFDYNIGSGDFFERQNIESRGIELMIDKSWSQGWYTNINVSLFDARYKDLDINTNENFKRIFNISVTKEFLTKKNNRWVFNLAYHQRGGGYQNVIETLNSYVTERRLSSYKRLDARFQYNWNRRNILTLDIQNLIGFSNEGYYYFDAFANEELLESQLGTIPILSYKRIL